MKNDNNEFGLDEREYVFGTFLDVLNRMFFCSVFWAFFWVKNVSKTDGFYLRFLGVFGTNLEVLKTSQKRKKSSQKRLKNVSKTDI